MTCVALARVRIKARFSSSDSADRTVFGSLRKRVNWGCTSELPKAVINRRAVLSTLERERDQLSDCCLLSSLLSIEMGTIKTLIHYTQGFCRDQPIKFNAF